MADPVSAAAVVGGASQVAGGVLGFVGANKQNKAARRAAAAQNRRERLQAVRQARIIQAEAQANAETSGVGGQSGGTNSGLAGFTGGVEGQLRSGVGFQQELLKYQNQQYKGQQLQAIGGLIGDIGSFASSASKPK